MSRKGSVGSRSIASTSTISISGNNGISGNNRGLQPCGASLTMVLHAQGSVIHCRRHESLTLERGFDRHIADVTVISIDNSSDEGAYPPRTVSVDEAKMAIVWELETGDEISRFEAFEDIRVAAWMKNGNLAFGDTMGNVILFDPVRAESISARTIFDPLCAIAPSADCKSFALGYNNGSILVAALSPSFTILHTLTTTSLSPSPITTLAWHTSSSKQKSDMLACQTRDGDLRVWSVPKSINSDDTARVVRVLKRPDCGGRGNNWLGWSRNGRIVQYSEGATSIWDVRTKNVTWEEVPTLGNVAGICIHGPKGTLFTFGMDNTVQQFSLYPPQLVTNIQYLPPPAPLAPPSPPVSVQEKREAEEIEPLQPLAAELHSPEPTEQNDNYPLGGSESVTIDIDIDNGLGISSFPEPSAPASVSSRSSAGSVSSRHKPSLSISSKGAEADSASASSPTQGQKSVGAGPQPSPRKLHPLRQEIHPSPDTPRLASPIAEVGDIFVNLRARMSAVTYDSSRSSGSTVTVGLTEDEQRREMLSCIFGWKEDVDGLINDELESVNARSLNALILRMWLGDLDQNSLAVLLGADFNVAGDWLFLALSAMGGQNSWSYVVRAYVMKLLQRDDLHLAVLCLLAIGDRNDAVEVYVSHNRYLEAVLLTSLLWKRDWKRISQLVRKWGEHAADTQDTTLAARCFACAGTEAPSERLQSTQAPAPPGPISQPNRVQRSHSRSLSRSSESDSVRGLSISAPSNPRTTLRMTPKDSPLKLITSFPTSPERDHPQRSATASPTVGMNRFFSGGGQRSATATPIAMSALTPIDPFWAHHDSFPPVKNIVAPSGSGPKLTPVTEASPADKTPVQQLPLPNDVIVITSPVEARKSGEFSESSKPVTLGDNQKLERSQTPTVTTPAPASPMTQEQSQQQVHRPLASTDPIPQNGFIHEVPRSSTPRTKLPGGLQIHWPQIDGILREGTPLLGIIGSHSRKGSRTSPPIPSGRSRVPTSPDDLKNFVGLVEKGHKRLDGQRAAPKGSLQFRRRAPSPGRIYPRKMSVEIERGRPAQVKTSAMRSPSSPLPFSPQAALYQDEDTGPIEIDSTEIPRPVDVPMQEAGGHHGQNRPGSNPLPLTLSPEQAAYYRDDNGNDAVDNEFDDERYYTSRRSPSRNRSRGRSRAKDGSGSYMRSPSSPLPMSPQAILYQEMSAEVDRQHEMEEMSHHHHRRPSAASIRMDSRNREGAQRRGLRRSRSERTLRQWSDQLERTGQEYTYSRNNSRHPSPAPNPLDSNMSIRGLPSNPRVWKSELQASSGSNSPNPGHRGRSPAPLRPGTPNYNHNRGVSPGARAMSPAPSTMHPPPRTSSRVRNRSTSRQPERPNAQSPPPAVSAVPRPANHYYNSPSVAEYESIGSPLMVPEVPPLPTLARAGSHKRNNSEPSFKPLIRKVLPAPPPDSPPPLPGDLPVHPALHVLPTTGRTLRRAKRSDELISPIDSGGGDHIVVGFDEERTRYGNGGGGGGYDDMQQGSGGNSRPRNGRNGVSPRIGYLNQI